MTEPAGRPDLERIIAPRTGHNFRDLGGYPTQDGRRVRARRVFRSGVMSRIGGEDIETLRSIGIVTICDFRTNDERARHPTSWHRDDLTELLARDHELSAGTLTEFIRRSDLSAADVRAMMRQLYRELPYEQAGSYRQMFERIAAGRLPLVFNCSAGKDRTGVAAALLLSALGVTRRDILDDYVRSNDTVRKLLPIVSADPVYGSLIRDRPDVAMPMLRAEPEYLDEMFSVVEDRHGSVAAYMAAILGVTDDMQATIRRELLE